MNSKTSILGISFALLAAMAYGVSSVLVKRGIATLAPPLVGATIALFSGTLILGSLSMRRPENGLREKKKSVALFLLSGMVAGLGILSSFFALSQAPVVIVTPLQSTSPLFSLLWARLFLGRMERVTIRTVVGTLLVLAGITLMTLGRNL